MTKVWAAAFLLASLTSCVENVLLMPPPGPPVQSSPPPSQVGAVEEEKGGPPPWAPAHGRRRKDAYRYRYYPAAEVYFDVDRALYFYLVGGAWKFSASLPTGITVTVSRSVVLELDSDKPYLEHEKHRSKFPPGLYKKHRGEGDEDEDEDEQGEHGRGKGKGHGKGPKWKDRESDEEGEGD